MLIDECTNNKFLRIYSATSTQSTMPRTRNDRYATPTIKHFSVVLFFPLWSNGKSIFTQHTLTCCNFRQESIALGWALIMIKTIEKFIIGWKRNDSIKMPINLRIVKIEKSLCTVLFHCLAVFMCVATSNHHEISVAHTKRSVRAIASLVSCVIAMFNFHRIKS